MAKNNKTSSEKRQIKEGALRPEGTPSGKPPISTANPEGSGSSEGQGQQGGSSQSSQGGDGGGEDGS